MRCAWVVFCVRPSETCPLDFGSRALFRISGRLFTLFQKSRKLAANFRPGNRKFRFYRGWSQNEPNPRLFMPPQQLSNQQHSTHCQIQLDAQTMLPNESLLQALHFTGHKTLIIAELAATCLLHLVAKLAEGFACRRSFHIAFSNTNITYDDLTSGTP